jgi:bifunctional non-homologous end joining protein LigD
MQLSLLPEPFDHPRFLYEIKHDGFRSLAYVSDGKCELVSRRKNTYKSFKKLQAEIGESLKVKTAIIDGEICCLDSKARSLFYELLRRRGTPVFYAFDLLYLNGKDLRHEPLIQRKRELEKLIKSAKCSSLLYAQHIEGRGPELFGLICKKDCEGVVAKRCEGMYSITETWFKFRNSKYSQWEGRRELFDEFHKTLKRAAEPKPKTRKRTG